MSWAEWSTVATGLAFPEAPRWHDGRLYVSEIFGGRVLAFDERGSVEVIVELAGRPSGLGWRPDGTMLVVSMQDQRVLGAVDGGRLEEVADLSALVDGDTNDMLVDQQGNAYVGSFGYDFAAGEERRAAVLVLIDPLGSARVVADDVWVPNGMAVTADGRMLLLAETHAEQITAFTITIDGGADDGSLTDRRVFAALDGARPDGIALDAEGAVWVASPVTGELIRVAEGGAVLAGGVAPNGRAQACALGGADGRTLFACCSPSHDPVEAAEGRSSIVATRVDVPAAG